MYAVVRSGGKQARVSPGDSLRLERIPGAGHFTHQEKPEEINRLLLSWLKEEGTGGA